MQRCRFCTNYPHGSCETVREFPMFGDLEPHFKLGYGLSLVQGKMYES